MSLFDEFVVDDCEARYSWRPPSELPSTRGVQHIDMDTESTGLKWHEQGVDVIGISARVSNEPWNRERPNDRCFYFPTAHAGGNNLSKEQVVNWCLAELPGKDLYFLNAKHDAKGLRKFGVDLERMGCRLHDVSHMAALEDEVRKRYNLDDLSAEKLGVKKITLNHGTLSGSKATMGRKTASEVGPYAERDAGLLRGLRDYYGPILREQSLLEVLSLEDRLIYTTMRMEDAAVRIDMALLDRYLRESQLAYEQELKTIRDVAGVVNPDAPKDMLKLFTLLRIPVEHFTEDEETGEPTETPSFSDDVLASVERDQRFSEGARLCIGAARRAKAIRSLRSKYLLKYQKAVGAGDLLRYSLNQLGQDDTGTVTGRYSSSNVNIQQVFKPSKQRRKAGIAPWIVRSLFLPRRGKRWLAADARQIELRIAAHYAAELGMTRLEQAYRDDPHVDFHDFVVDMRERASGIRPDRDLTKNFSFMRLFGGGIKRAMEMTGYDEGKARAELDAYDREFPEFKKMGQAISEVAEKRRWVKTVRGRRRHFDKDKKESRFYSAPNAVIQGSAGDINKQKLLELDAARGDLGIELMFTVHDEADMNAEDDSCCAGVQRLLDEQTTPMRVPILWEVAVGKNWAELGKFKAEDYVSKDGKNSRGGPGEAVRREHRREAGK